MFFYIVVDGYFVGPFSSVEGAQDEAYGLRCSGVSCFVTVSWYLL